MNTPGSNWEFAAKVRIWQGGCRLEGATSEPAHPAVRITNESNAVHAEDDIRTVKVAGTSRCVIRRTALRGPQQCQAPSGVDQLKCCRYNFRWRDISACCTPRVLSIRARKSSK